MIMQHPEALRIPLDYLRQPSDHDATLIPRHFLALTLISVRLDPGVERGEKKRVDL